MIHTIAFPGLGISAVKIKNSFSVFGFTVHWYGVIIACGIVLAYLFAVREGKKKGITQDHLLDVIIIGLPSAIICARLYYVIFEWEQYRGNLWNVFKIWEGGLAIYGGVIGAFVSAFVYCRAKKIPFFKLADLGGFGFLIGQSVGRWGNFVNAEAYGAQTTLPWRMELVDLAVCVHPTFLYESLWNVGVFLFLLWYRKKQKFDGEIFFLYLTGYGLGRLWIEGLRTDSLYLGAFRVSQLLAAVFVVLGIIGIVSGRKHAKKQNEIL